VSFAKILLRNYSRRGEGWKLRIGTITKALNLKGIEKMIIELVLAFSN